MISEVRFGRFLVGNFLWVYLRFLSKRTKFLDKKFGSSALYENENKKINVRWR